MMSKRLKIESSLKYRLFFTLLFITQLLLNLFVSFFVNFKTESLLYYTLLMISFTPYLLNLLVVPKLKLNYKFISIFFISTTLLLGISFLPINVNVDHDVYRYKWDGYISSLGINPYSNPPIFYQDSQIEKHFPYWQDLEFKYYRTIYPYTSQFIFLVDYLFFGFSILGTKLFFLAFLLCCIPISFKISSLLKADSSRLWLFFANPLVLYETVGSVHNDIVMIFFLLYFLKFYIQKRYVLSGYIFALAIAVKFIPILIFPIFIKHSKSIYFFISAFFLLLAIYTFSSIFVPLQNVFSTILTYSINWTYTPGIFALVEWLLKFTKFSNPALLTKILFWLGYLIILAFLMLKKITDKNIIYFCSIIIGYLLLFNSVLFPWYVIWILFLTPFQKNSTPWIILSLTSFIIPLYGYSDNGINLYRQILIWIPVYTSFIYASFVTIKKTENERTNS